MKKSLLAGLDLTELNPAPVTEPAQGDAQGGLFIPLDAIQPDAAQPRKMSADADEDLKLLAESILQHGVLQPITVQAMGSGKYQIVAGERRLRAAKLALERGRPCARKGYDLKRIPVFIRNPESATDRLEMQMVENLARADMSDTDIGTALHTLLRTTGVPKAELARRLGRSVTWVQGVLAKSSPEAVEVATRIGVPLDSVGAGESLRMISWAKDPEKCAVLDAIAEEIKAGRVYSRALIDDAEERYGINRRFPRMAGRTDLTLEDLRTWQTMWASSDPAQRAVAQRVLDGASLAEALQVPVEDSPSMDTEEDEVTDDVNFSSPLLGNEKFDEFQMDDAEAENAEAARATLFPPATPPVATPPVQGRSDDAAGLSMESGRGPAPVADSANLDITVRIPSDLVTRILQKAGIPEDLTVDPEAVLQAIKSLL